MRGGLKRCEYSKLTSPKRPPYTKNLGPDAAKYLEVYNDANNPANEKMLNHIVIRESDVNPVTTNIHLRRYEQ